MGVAERKQRERSDLRQKIVDAARQLFAEEGYEAATMRRLADRIEYSPTAIYQHFPDKLAVLEAVCACDFLALAETFREIAAVADPIARLRAAGRAYCRFAAEHPNHYRLMFMTPLPPHDHRDLGIEKGNPDQDAYAFLLGTVAEGIAAGRFRPELRGDAEPLAQTIWAGVHGVVALRIAKGNDDWIEWRPLEDAVEATLDMILGGVLADGDPARAPGDRAPRRAS